MQIFVKTLTARTITLTLDSVASVESLKEHILCREGAKTGQKHGLHLVHTTSNPSSFSGPLPLLFLKSQSSADGTLQAYLHTTSCLPVAGRCWMTGAPWPIAQWARTLPWL